MKQVIALLLSSSCVAIGACGGDDRASAPLIEDTGDDGGRSRRARDSGSARDATAATDARVSKDGAQDAAKDASTSSDASKTAKDASTSSDASTNDDLLVPRVKILAPSAAVDPNLDEVLVQVPVTVRCQVEKSTAANAVAVDKSSVKIELASGTTTLQKKDGVMAEDGVYEATFTLADFVPGKIAFRCSAKDTAAPPRLGSNEIQTFFDPGPNVEVELVTPQPDTSYPVKGNVLLQFRISPVLMNVSDTEADINTVTLKAAGVELPISQFDPTNKPGVYGPPLDLAVDFSNTLTFPDTPNGPTPILVTATNKRSPQLAVGSLYYSIILDSQGPVIAIEKPTAGQIVGGEVLLKFTVKDSLSLVDPNSIVVQINDQNHAYDTPGEQWSRDGDAFFYRFDTRNVTGSKVQITINIDAKDECGNEAAGAAMVLLLDNQPPLISLDPPNVRERKKSSDKYYCSYTFDPVGDRAVYDRKLVRDMAFFRAVVWDLTNTASGQTTLHFSLVDPDSVYLYVQDDSHVQGDGSRKSLLINTSNQNGFCDDLDWEGLPDLQMTPLTPAGNSYFGADPLGYNFAQYPKVPWYNPGPGSPVSCEPENSYTLPSNLCASYSSDLTRVISHRISGNKEPVIYAVNVGDSNSVTCTGDDWELPPIAKKGWLCVAVRAKDNAGNVGISRPLRICLEPLPDGGTGGGIDGGTDGPVDRCQDAGPPTCTDDCKLPPDFLDAGVFDRPIDIF